MAKAFINDENLTDIADAIRATLDESRQYLPSEMAAAIDSIPIMAQLNRKKYFQAVPTGAASGYATIEQIEGNTVVWNQLVDTGSTSVVVQSGHVYYANINGTASIATSDGTPISVTGGSDIIHDLTLIFGAGNEPTTVADFEAWLAQNIGTLPYYDYNAGELLSVKMSGMQTEDSSQQTLDTMTLDVTTITGINTATNVREVMFVDGMNSTADGDVDVIDLTSDIAERTAFVLPDTYQELEYIESSGTQYIDTNIVPNLDYEFEIKAKKQSGFSLIGSGSSDYTLTGSSTQNYLLLGNARTYVTTTIDPNAVHIWKVKDGYLYCDEEAASLNSSAVTPTNSFALFARKVNSTTYNDAGSHVVYYVKIYDDNGELVFWGIPVKRIADNVLGLYDTVSGNFFTNIGTGSFIAGTDVYKAHALDTPITYTDLQDGNGNPLNPRYKVEQGGTEQVLPVNTSTPTTVAPILTTTYNKNI